MKQIDAFLNSITMYRLVLYYLIFLLAAAFGLTLFHVLPYNPLAIPFSVLFLLVVCWITNKIFAWVYEAPVNVESVYISALILALIITPPQTVHNLVFLAWAGIWAMASKYILALQRKHIFNPVAFGVALPAFFAIGSASWWVGTLAMLPFVLFGVLIVRKIQRADMVLYFLLVALLTIVGFGLARGTAPLVIVRKALVDSPLLFFAFIMLTEPLTTPPTRVLQSWYGALVGLLFAPQLHLGSIYSTPELALLVGNLASFTVSPKGRQILTLQEKQEVATGIFDFVFLPERPMRFAPGQYLEWTLPHKSPDNRGNRRYFTIASSPTEPVMRVGVRYFPQSSTYKQSLINLAPGSRIVAAQLAGDFVLPKDPSRKLAFIAGGIGITPFRSMVQYVLDTDQKRDIILFYSVNLPQEFAYTDVFTTAEKQFGLRTSYTVTDDTPAASNWTGRRGPITQDVLRAEAPDWAERTFYISGPHAMVEAVASTLKQLGVPKKQIITDFFPGFV